MTPSLTSSSSPLSRPLLSRASPAQQDAPEQHRHPSPSISVTSGVTPALRQHAQPEERDHPRPAGQTDGKWAGLRSPWKAGLVLLLLGTAAVKSTRAGLSGGESAPLEGPAGTGDSAPATSPYAEGTVVTQGREAMASSVFIKLAGTNSTETDKPTVSGGVSPSTAAALSSLCTLALVHTVPPWLTHSSCVSPGPWQSVLRRHESLLGENLSVRGLVQMYNYANLAVPGALKPNATEQQQFKWAVAAAPDSTPAGRFPNGGVRLCVPRSPGKRPVRRAQAQASLA